MGAYAFGRCRGRLRPFRAGFSGCFARCAQDAEIRSDPPVRNAACLRPCDILNSTYSGTHPLPPLRSLFMAGFSARLFVYEERHARPCEGAPFPCVHGGAFRMHRPARPLPHGVGRASIARWRHAMKPVSVCDRALVEQVSPRIQGGLTGLSVKRAFLFETMQVRTRRGVTMGRVSVRRAVRRTCGKERAQWRRFSRRSC